MICEVIGCDIESSCMPPNQCNYCNRRLCDAHLILVNNEEGEKESICDECLEGFKSVNTLIGGPNAED